MIYVVVDEPNLAQDVYKRQVKYQSAGDHKIRQYESIPEDGEATDK